MQEYYVRRFGEADADDPKCVATRLARVLWRSRGGTLGEVMALQLPEVVALLDTDWEQQSPGAAIKTALPEPPALPPARHSKDFRSVHWFGTDYGFTPTQAACVKVLWAAWENGTPDLGQDTILEHPEVEAESKRLFDVFRDHPAWGTMIVKGQTAGAYRLAELPRNG